MMYAATSASLLRSILLSLLDLDSVSRLRDTRYGRVKRLWGRVHPLDADELLLLEVELREVRVLQHRLLDDDHRPEDEAPELRVLAHLLFLSVVSIALGPANREWHVDLGQLGLNTRAAPVVCDADVRIVPELAVDVVRLRARVVHLILLTAKRFTPNFFALL